MRLHQLSPAKRLPGFFLSSANQTSLSKPKFVLIFTLCYRARAPEVVSLGAAFMR
jgi:hypothetical protein